MKKIAILIIIQTAIFSCNVPLKQDKINKWFYGLPVHAENKEIIKHLVSDDRFIIEEVPDTNDIYYTYRARINKEYQSPAIHPDSSVIDFTFINVKPNNQNFSLSLKMLTVTYFFSNSKEVEDLYKESYRDLKSFFNKGHDISEIVNDEILATGKEIVYVKSDNNSQTLDILKPTNVNGPRRLKLVLSLGEP